MPKKVEKRKINMTRKLPIKVEVINRPDFTKVCVLDKNQGFLKRNFDVIIIAFFTVIIGDLLFGLVVAFMVGISLNNTLWKIEGNRAKVQLLMEIKNDDLLNYRMSCNNQKSKLPNRKYKIDVYHDNSSAIEEYWPEKKYIEENLNLMLQANADIDSFLNEIETENKKELLNSLRNSASEIGTALKKFGDINTDCTTLARNSDEFYSRGILFFGNSINSNPIYENLFGFNSSTLSGFFSEGVLTSSTLGFYDTSDLFGNIVSSTENSIWTILLRDGSLSGDLGVDLPWLNISSFNTGTSLIAN